jgi:uncharacterized membrane protein
MFTHAPRVFSTALLRGRTAAVVALTGVALALWVARGAWTGGPDFEWFLWNLALAWVPWVAARGLRHARGLPAIVATAAVWLLFLPNAPYLVTDFVHLRARPPVPLWFDVLFFAAFALAGCGLCWAALEEVHGRLARALGRTWAAVAIAAVHPLVGFGVYLGRFDRWNSWDLLVRPRALLSGAVEALGDPRALAFSAAFGLLVGAGYLLISPCRELAPAEARTSD